MKTHKKLVSDIGNTPRDVKSVNMKLIINLLQKNGSLTKTELARVLQLSNPTIAKNVETLIEKNLATEFGVADTPNGRKPMAVAYNADWGCVAAVDLSEPAIHIAVGNMRGEVIKSGQIENVFVLNHEVYEEAASLLDRLVSLQPSPLVKICVSTPWRDVGEGLADFHAQRFKDATFENIKRFFSERYPVEVLVDNSLNLAAQAECTYDPSVQNAVYLNIGYTVEAALILNGGVYTGSNGRAGALGAVSSSLSTLNGGRFTYEDSLEYKTNIPAIKRYVKEMLYKYKNTKILQIAGNADEITFEQIVTAALYGDEICLRAVGMSVKLIAGAVRNLIEIFDPDTIIFGGHPFLKTLGYIEQVESGLPSIKARLRYALYDQNPALYGALSAGVSKALEDALDRENE